MGKTITKQVVQHDDHCVLKFWATAELAGTLTRCKALSALILQLNTAEIYTHTNKTILLYMDAVSSMICFDYQEPNITWLTKLYSTTYTPMP